MNPGAVTPTIGNTIGAMVIGWGVSCLYVLVSRDPHTPPSPRSSHTRFIGYSACSAFRSGHTISDTQMTAHRTRSWCVIRIYLFRREGALMTDTRICCARHRRSSHYGTRVPSRAAFTRPHCAQTGRVSGSSRRFIKRSSAMLLGSTSSSENPGISSPEVSNS